jgi:hypothetical protein
MVSITGETGPAHGQGQREEVLKRETSAAVGFALQEIEEARFDQRRPGVRRIQPAQQARILINDQITHGRLTEVQVRGR